MNRWLICLTFFSLHQYGIAQQHLQPRFETLDVENGLSQNSVYRIYQDKRGFMWFGTADGLNRYDGTNIRVFKSKSKAIAKANSNYIRGWICEDDLGRLWYANETGIYFYNPVKEEIEQAYDFVNEQIKGLVYYSVLTLDNDNNLWLTNPGKGVVRYSIHSKTLEVIKFPDDIKQNEFAITPLPTNRYIFLQIPTKPGILRFDLRLKQYDWLFKEYENVFVRSDSRELFLIQDKKLFHYDSLTREVRDVPLNLSSPISDVFLDSAGRYWISTFGDGIHVYHPKERKSYVYHHETATSKSLSSEITTCLFKDSKDNLWIGTDGGGVSRIDLKPPRFNIFPILPSEHPELNDYFVRCFYEDPQGRIWFGTSLEGLVIYNPIEGTLKKYSHRTGDKKSLPDNSVGSILRDSSGNIWVGHNKGISLFDEKKNQFLHVPIMPHPNVMTNNIRVTEIKELIGGKLLVSSSFGIYIIQKDKEGFYYGYTWKDFTSNTSGVLQSKNGIIWVASQVQGLYGVRPTDSLIWAGQNFFDRINIRSIHQDEREPEIIWLCSGAGLIRFDTHSKEYKFFSEEHGIPGSLVYGMVEDENQNFWLSTNSGLCFFDRKKETFQNFTVKDGLQSNEFNTGAFYKGPSGTIYFGGIKGFNWFKTGVERFNQKPPRAVVVSTMVNDQRIVNDSSFYFTRSLTLPYNRNDLSFEFAVLDFARPEANKVQYQLEGWDKQWITTYLKSVRYSNLPHGKYILRVRASAGDVWGREDQIVISIKAPFWDTTWFYGGLSLFILLFVVGITRMIANRKFERKFREIEKQRAISEERERISKDIHDDLGTGLSKISILSELAKQTHGEEFTTRQLEKISQVSHELIDNLGELIWSHTPTNDSLQKLFWYIREHLSPAFDGTDIKFKIVFPELIEDRDIPAEWRRNIFLVTKEALHNVLKHSQASIVSLKFSIQDKKLMMVVTDNGRGFDVKLKASTGYGLANIRKRVEDCGGTLQITSTIGEGTTLRIEVPLG